MSPQGDEKRNESYLAGKEFKTTWIPSPLAHKNIVFLPPWNKTEKRQLMGTSPTAYGQNAGA